MNPSGKMALAVIGLSGLISAASFAATAADTAVTWPQGWAIRDLPIPRTAAGETFPGSNQMAIKLNGDGSPLAAIALTSLVPRAGDSPHLDVETQTMLATVQSGYGAKGLKGSCSATIKTTLGTLPALQSVCKALKGEILSIEQVVIVAIGTGHVYALSYTAPPAGFDAYTADFAAVRGSLHLE